MAQNEGRSPENSKRSHASGELSPWLKGRLLARKLHSARVSSAMVRLGERSGRLSRRIMNPRPLSPGVLSRIPISRPFVVTDRKDALPPPGWQALTLLLSHPSRNLSGYDNPAGDRWEAPAQPNMTGPVRQAVKQPLPVHRTVTVAHGTGIVRRKIEETPDHNQGLSGNISQSGDERRTPETSGSKKFESDSTGRLSGFPVETARGITPGEEPLGTGFVQKSVDKVSDFLLPDSQDGVRNPGDSSKTGDHTADTGFKPIEKIVSDFPVKGKNQKKPLIFRKKISGSLKQVLAGITRRPSRPQAKSSEPPSSDNRKRSGQPEIEHQIVITGAHATEKNILEIIEEQDTGNSRVANNVASKRNESIDNRTIDFGKVNIVGNPAPDISEKELRTSEQVNPTGEIVSAIAGEREYLAGDISPEIPHEQAGLSGDLQVADSRKEIQAPSDSQLAEFYSVNNKLDPKDPKISAKTHSLQGLAAEKLGRINKKDDLKNPIPQSKRLLSGSRPLSPDSVKENIVRNPGPDMSGKKLRMTEHDYPTGEIASEIIGKRNYLARDTSSARTGEQMSPSGEIQVVASRKDFPSASSQQPVEFHFVNNKLDQKNTEVYAKTQFSQGLTSDRSGRVNKDDVHSPVYRSNRLFSDSSPLSRGIVRRLTPDFATGSITPRRLSFAQPAGGTNSPRFPVVSGINPDFPFSDRSNEDLNKKGISGISHEIFNASESELFDNRQIPETAAGKPADAVFADSSQNTAVRKNEGVVYNRNSGLPGSRSVKQMVLRRSLLQPVIGLSASTFISPISRSIELPVPRSKQPATALGANYPVDNAPPIPGFNFNTLPPLDLPVPVSPGAKGGVGESMESKISRQPSDISPAKTGYYPVRQPNITHFDLLSGTKSLAQSSSVTDSIQHFNQMGAGTGSIMQSDVAQRSENSAVDLKALARDIYPYIKRMIMIEKERLPDR